MNCRHAAFRAGIDPLSPLLLYREDLTGAPRHMVAPEVTYEGHKLRPLSTSPPAQSGANRR